MRTNIEIDDKLMKETMRATGSKTKRGAVEAAMKQSVQMHRQQQALKKLDGILVRNGAQGWDETYDYKKMRESKPTW